MSKAVIVTDIHFGSRGDSDIFLKALERFFKEDFFPYLDENEIKIVINLGDTYDKRTSIKFATFEASKRMFFDELEVRGIEYHTIIGNHDTAFKNTNYPNSVQELLTPKYPKFHYHFEPALVRLGNTNIQFIPWMNPSNEDEYLRVIEKSNADFLFGHFSINGALMQRGQTCDHGLDPKALTKFEVVGSGHFHHRSVRDNIWYFGSPYQMTWNDHGNEKGFHVVDLDTREIEFVQNNYDVFHSFDYNEDSIPKFDGLNLEGTFIRVNIVKNTQQTKYDAFLTMLDSQNPFRIDIIDRREYELTKDLTVAEGSDEEAVEGEIDLASIKNTGHIIKEYVDALDVDDEMKKIMAVFCDDLYKEALSIKV